MLVASTKSRVLIQITSAAGPDVHGRLYLQDKIYSDQVHCLAAESRFKLLVSLFSVLRHNTHIYLPWLFYFPHPLSKVVQSRSYRCPRRALGNPPEGNTRTKPGIRTSVTHVRSSAYVNIQPIFKYHAI